MFNVSWSLRKTSVLKAQAKKLEEAEGGIFREEDEEKPGSVERPKKWNWGENFRRIGAALVQVDSIDEEITRLRMSIKD